MIRECIPSLLEDHHLTSEQAKNAMREIMSGEATPAHVAAFLVALKKKKETVEEVTALAETMREFSKRIYPKIDGPLLDTCGTGGDKTKSFNVSTTCAFVIAGSGVPVAKHGNRSFTSHCGSADVLEHLGLNLNMTTETVRESIEKLGVGFMFAPNFHPAMKNVASVRKEVGVRTVFNMLGPLTNPAGANTQLIGVYDQSLLDPMCEAAHRLGSQSVMTVYGLEGTDEVSISGKTAITSIHNGKLAHDEIEPEDFGLNRARPEEVASSTVEENARLTAGILFGSLPPNDPRLQMVLANAAAGLFLSGEVKDLRDGVELAKRTVQDRAGFKKLRDLISFSGGETARLENLV